MVEHFGEYLRRERQLRNMGLSDVSRRTRIPVRSLEKLEEGKYELLPGEVFVRGFIRSYARCVGIDDEEALLRYDSEREKRRREAEQALAAQAGSRAQPGEEPTAQSRRRVGLAVFVLVVLIIATITLSLLLRRQYQADGGLSIAPAVEVAENDHVSS